MAKAAAVVATNWNIILLAGITMIGTSINGVTAVYMARVMAETKVVVDKTHDAVNSTASKLAAAAEAAAAENKRLREEIYQLSKAKAVRDERSADRERPR